MKISVLKCNNNYQPGYKYVRNCLTTEQFNFLFTNKNLILFSI